MTPYDFLRPMANLLAIETATDVCSVAIARDGIVRCTMSVHEPRRHAEMLVPLIRDGLSAAGLVPSELDAVAVSAGPGSYTGLRIGVSAAKGICFATDAALVAVPTLLGIAILGYDALPDADPIMPALRSRRGEVYTATFGPGSPVPIAIHPAAVLTFREALGRLADDDRRRPAIVGDGAAGFARMETPGLRAPRLVPGLSASASAIARAGSVYLAAGDVVDLDGFEPYYLRPFKALPSGRSAFDRLPF